MCGIAGIINFDNAPPGKELIRRMTDNLRHRGPDGEGFYFDTQVAFGHRRLAIIDLSENGKQPMKNEEGSIWMVFNGEIYNYKELKKDLINKGHEFKSETDCEIVIHAYEEYGTKCVCKFNGMWAFAIWDERNQKIFASRDRFGIKPFYYYLDKNRFLFASEIKALLTDKAIKRSPNDKVIFTYLAYEDHDYIDYNEETFFLGIKRLPPAHSIVVDTFGKVEISRFWDLDPSVNQNHISDNEASSRFYELFRDSVNLRLQSDVPVGTCLSGGIDSSSITVMINKLIIENSYTCTSVIGDRQKTFSACFDDATYDESEYIKAVVDATRVDGNIVFPKGEDLFPQFERFMWHQEEPVFSATFWAEWQVMKLAKQRGVTVVLNGQGADEILAGYYIYFKAYFKDLLRNMKLIKLMREINHYSKYYGYSREYILRNLMNDLLLKRNAYQYPLWLNKDFVRSSGNGVVEEKIKYKDYFRQCLYHFLTLERLPALLRFLDKSSMAFSVEARLPFLDYRLVEFCFSLPPEQKLREGRRKIVLMNAFSDSLPERVINRTQKVGFVTPEAKWLKTVCRNNVLEIINSASFRNRVYFDAARIKEHYNRFLSGEFNSTRSIWRYINLELWMRVFCDNRIG